MNTPHNPLHHDASHPHAHPHAHPHETHHHHQPRPGREMALVPLGGALLAAVAGYVNVVLIDIGHTAVTHVTGTVSRLSDDLAHGRSSEAAHLAALAACFAAGAVISGVIIGRPSLHLHRPYGLALLAEATLLAAAALALPVIPPAGVMLAAAAAGLQNAMASSYGGQIVRTTHVTGILTDLGFLIGRWMRHREVEPWKLFLLLTLLLAFAGGGALGAVASDALKGAALWIPAALIATMGSSYFLWRITRR